MWRENPDITQTLATLVGSGADIIGVNEAAGWIGPLETAAYRNGYRVHYADDLGRVGRQNPILLHDHIKADVDTMLISDAVGRSPQRGLTRARFELHDQGRTHFNTHWNSHVQEGPDNPHELPRVREWVEGALAMIEAIRTEQRDGRRVTLTGDLNWAWDTAVDRWRYSPERLFAKVGMVAQFADPTAPKRPRRDRRPIEYVVYDPADLVLAGQRFLGPERSDHPLHECTFQVRP